MNKKFAVGLSSLALAGTFLACGDGDIFVKSEGDDAIQFAYVDAQDSSMMKNAIKDCQNDPVCKEKMGNYNPDVPSNPTTSSASQQQPGPINPSSSSTVLLPPSLASSSSLTIPDLGTSSASGDIPTPPQGGTNGDLGSCAPVTSPIEKGDSTSWKFTFNNKNTSGVTPMDILNFDADWNFGNAGNPSVVTVKGLASPGYVTYMNSGSATASVTLSNGLKTETIQCSPLQVNGDPITGCKCEPAASTLDFTADPNAVWTVTGCTSSSMPLTYSWDGAPGEASFTKAFTAATPAYAPTLKVANSDNTVIDVTCGSVKVTEGAEYEIKTSQGKVEFAEAGKYAVVISGGTALTACRISCNANGPLTATAKGKTFTGSYYLNFEGIDVSWCNTTLDLELSAAATCEASWN